MVKLLGVSPEYVLWEMTWENVVLYSQACPTYGCGEREWDPGKDANDPGNPMGSDGLVTDPFN